MPTVTVEERTPSDPPPPATSPLWEEYATVLSLMPIYSLMPPEIEFEQASIALHNWTSYQGTPPDSVRALVPSPPLTLDWTENPPMVPASLPYSDEELAGLARASLGVTTPIDSEILISLRTLRALDDYMNGSPGRAIPRQLFQILDNPEGFLHDLENVVVTLHGDFYSQEVTHTGLADFLEHFPRPWGYFSTPGASNRVGFLYLQTPEIVLYHGDLNPDVAPLYYFGHYWLCFELSRLNVERVGEGQVTIATPQGVSSARGGALPIHFSGAFSPRLMQHLYNPHPHISTRGKGVCLGNAGGSVLDALRIGDLEYAYVNIVDILQKYGSTNPYVSLGTFDSRPEVPHLLPEDRKALKIPHRGEDPDLIAFKEWGREKVREVASTMTANAHCPPPFPVSLTLPTMEPQNTCVVCKQAPVSSSRRFTTAEQELLPQLNLPLATPRSICANCVHSLCELLHLA